MTIAIDDSAAGRYRAPFHKACERFRAKHRRIPAHIFAGGVTAASFVVNIRETGDEVAGWPLAIAPTLDMEESIFKALEDWWSRRKQSGS